MVRAGLGSEPQIVVLNQAYERHGYQFELQDVRRYNVGRFAKKCLNGRVERQFKRANAVDPRHTLNISTCRPAQGVLGYAYFPSDFAGDDPLHGVVLHYATLPGGSGAPYNEGDTLTHEVGHYLDLFHTF